MISETTTKNILEYASIIAESAISFPVRRWTSQIGKFHIDHGRTENSSLPIWVCLTPWTFLAVYSYR